MKKTLLLATSAAFCLAGTANAAVVEEHQSIQS
jgi:opacity protein-like surface antigen